MKRKRYTHTLLAVWLTVAILFGLAGSGYSQLADSPWPMFGHDARHTGRSPFIGPEAPNIAWTIKASQWIPPLIGKNGIIYAYESNDGRLSLRLDGSIYWKQQGSSIQAISSDNKTLYSSSGDSIYALNLDGTKKWTFPKGGRNGYLLVDSLDRIIIDDGNKLTSLSPNGVQNWQFELKSDAFITTPELCPAIGLDGSIYLRDADGIKAVDPNNGTLKWTYRIYVTSGKPTNSITVGEDGTIYVGNATSWSDDPLLYAINIDGTIKWKLDINDLGIISDRYSIFSPCAVGADSTIYLGVSTGWNDDGYLCAVDPDGNVKWTFQAWKGFPGTPICDADGKVYAVSGDGVLFCFDSNGSKLWEYTIGKPYGEKDNYSYPVIDSLGTLYVVGKSWYSGTKLFAFFEINPAYTPDLSIIADSIRFEPISGNAISGKDVKIKVPVKEIGGLQSAAFDVFFYADNLSNPIDSVRAYAPADFTTIVEGTWDTEGFSAKTYQIIILVKNANPAESNLTNNQAETSFQLLPSIQERIDLAQVGDTVWVAPGTYYENLTLKKGVVVKSTHGPEQTIIDGNGENSVIKALHLDPTAVIEGFTLTNGYQTTFGGGGIYIERGGVTVRNNIICDNDATEGGAIWMIGSFVESDPIIENNLIVNNHASFEGGAVYANNSWALFRNNTVINNSSTFSDKTGGIHMVGYFSPSAGIVNCIIQDNGINLGGTASAVYSCIEDSSSGVGNIFSDPMFVDPANGNYALQENSPCIDAGDPGSPRDPDGTRADMGWKYFDQSATIARIMGRLTDATTGAPVTMAKVCLSGPRDDLVPPDASGNYVFAVPADTGYTVSVYAPNHSSAKQEHLQASIGEATVVDFSLMPYPTQIALFPPSDLEGTYENGSVHLSWQRPMDEQAFDDGFYEAAVGFQNSQGILAAGPFEPTNYPAKIQKIKVAFDGERAGDKIELSIYFDESGTSSEPSASMLIATKSNIPIEVGGGFQEIDISDEGLTLNNGNFFVGIKQLHTEPMYMLLDQSSPDGNAFLDDNLDGIFSDLSSENIHGALAIRGIVSMPSGGGLLCNKNVAITPTIKNNAVDSVRILSLKKNLPVGLVTKKIESSKNNNIIQEEKNVSNLQKKPPQALYIYRSLSSPVELSNDNKIATLGASSTYYDDMNLETNENYYYIAAARYTDGTIAPTEEISVSILTEVEKFKDVSMPDEFALSQNYPNPFNPETTIKYQLPNPSEVTINIYNVTGQRIRTLTDQKQSAGYYSVVWNGKDDAGRDVSSGVYFYQLQAKGVSGKSKGNFVETRKMVLVR